MHQEWAWGLATLVSERPLWQQSKERSRGAGLEAEDFGKRSEKGNKHGSVALRREWRSLSRSGTKVSGQEMEGRGILLLSSGLSSHKVAGP